MSPIYIYIYSLLSEQPPIYIPPDRSWAGTNNAGQLTAIHTTCRGVARLVLLRHATGRAIRSTRTTSRSGRGKSAIVVRQENPTISYDNEGPPRLVPRPSHDRRTTTDD